MSSQEDFRRWLVASPSSPRRQCCRVAEATPPTPPPSRRVIVVTSVWRWALALVGSQQRELNRMHLKLLEAEAAHQTLVQALSDAQASTTSDRAAAAAAAAKAHAAQQAQQALTKALSSARAIVAVERASAAKAKAALAEARSGGGGTANALALTTLSAAVPEWQLAEALALLLDLVNWLLAEARASCAPMFDHMSDHMSHSHVLPAHHPDFLVLSIGYDSMSSIGSWQRRSLI